MFQKLHFVRHFNRVIVVTNKPNLKGIPRKLEYFLQNNLKSLVIKNGHENSQIKILNMYI